MATSKDQLQPSEWRTGNPIVDLEQWMKNVGAEQEANVLPDIVTNFYKNHLLPHNLSVVGITGEASDPRTGYHILLNVLQPDQFGKSLEDSILINDISDVFTEEFFFKQLKSYPPLVSAHLLFATANITAGSFEQALQSQKEEQFIGMLSPQAV